MIEYLKTTTLILAMVFVLSLIAGAVFTAFLLWRSSGRKKESDHNISWPIPAMVTAPACIAIVYLAFNHSAIFPSLFDLDAISLVGFSMLPACVLLIASGMLQSLYTVAKSDIDRWRHSQFYLFSKSLGLSNWRVLGKLVLSSALVQSWSKCLPWIFGELIVVEALFNAPGLGLDLWHFAKTQDTSSLLQALAWLSALYLIAFSCSRYWVHRLGERLASYA